MKGSKIRLPILMILGVLLLGACNVSKLFHSTDDKAITTDIQAKLYNDPALKTRDIHVDSRNGIVTLSGSVDSELEKSAVERIATQEAGVKNVVDTVSVNSQSATLPPEGAPAPVAVPPAPQPEAPVAAPPQPKLAREKPHHSQPPKPRSEPDKAAAQLRAYTNSVDPEMTTNPAPPQAPAAAPVPPQQLAAPPSPPPPSTPPPTPAPKPKEHLVIPAGTVVTVRMIDTVDSSRNSPGDEFAASLDSPLVVGDRTLGSRGSDARVRLAKAQSAGRLEGRSELQLELISLKINGVAYPTTSGYYEQHGGSRGRRTAETVGGGAVLGALIGGILGHGKGAAIGSVAGAGAGTAVQVSTKGQQVKVPAETKLDFTLTDPVTVTINPNQ